MASAETATETPGRLLELVGRLNRQEGFAEVVESMRAGHAATLDGVWGSSCALAAAALAAHCPAVLAVVCPLEEQADELRDDLELFTQCEPERFPARESIDTLPGDEDCGRRIRLLKRLDGGALPKIIVAGIQALVQPVPSRETLRRQTRLLRRGATGVIEELARWMVEGGMAATTAVDLPGEFAVRGGIVDVFAPDWEEPVRIEFFGEEIDSIRRFDIASQRSLESLDSVEITLVGRQSTGATAGPSSSAGFTVDRSHLADHLPPQSWFLLVEPMELERQGRQYVERMETARLHEVSNVLRGIFRFPSVTASGVAAASLETTCRLRIESVEQFSGEINRVRDELDEATAGQQVYIVCQTEAEIRRLQDVFAVTAAAAEGRLHYQLGNLSHGFRLVSERIVVIGSGELFHRIDLRRTPQRRLSRAIDSFLDLREGDLIVHVGHGIGRYRGMKLLEKNGQVEEHLELEFHAKTKLYVPATKIGLVQKYVGGTKGRPKLAKLGGRMWERRKNRVERAVSDLAADMLDLQAARASRPGIAYPPDTEWQREFDASFPYVETADQLTTIDAIKRDMCLARPMDRLLCGDVGYGKTELAMRAAFKAIDAGYQVAVLVPTTLLCEQHLRTFTARMAEYPFEIASLSRFATRRQQKEIIERLEQGAIDIVIGTHRLAQPDVKFRNLGLVIIDEEQRFGVEVKERLKALRRIVDVLTMTATPIPRTLHMGLLGLRDISNLQTPPEDRLAVETRVGRFDQELIREAVLRELNRGGQIFFAHNRVQDIEKIARRLRQIVPEAAIAVAHGQMHEHDLERVMLDFIDRRADMLLATTIIESGLDIPNANTIFIDEADRYGLADLHQLRGRVGRYKHRAYCHLLIDPNKNLTPNAAKRLRAIEEYSRLGAGFAIAMRDLEIRGAGNILGSEQSGHIAAIGYELYCNLLENAVRRLKRLPPESTIDVDIDLPGKGYIPRSYVPDMRLKIDLYRRLARVAHQADLSDLEVEFSDRFGSPPPPVRHLLQMSQLRIDAHRWGIKSINLEERYVVFWYSSEPRIRRLASAVKGRLRVVDGRSAYLPLGKELTDPAKIIENVKSLLRNE